MRQRGQALIETAITIPLMILVGMVVIAVMVMVVARVQVSAATALAAAAAAQAPADPTTSRQWADQSFVGSLTNLAYLRIDGLDSTAPYTCRRDNPSSTRIRCHGHATLLFTATPLAILGLVEIPIDSYSEATAPVHRSV